MYIYIINDWDFRNYLDKFLSTRLLQVFLSFLFYNRYILRFYIYIHIFIRSCNWLDVIISITLGKCIIVRWNGTGLDRIVIELRDWSVCSQTQWNIIVSIGMFNRILGSAVWEEEIEREPDLWIYNCHRKIGEPSKLGFHIQRRTHDVPSFLSHFKTL